MASLGSTRAGPIGLAVILACISYGCETTLHSDVSQDQANAILVALHEAAIPASKVREEGAATVPRFRIQVASKDVARALAVLRQAELPKRPDAGFESLLSRGSLIPSPAEDRARMHAALGGELATSLGRIDRVLDARVHLALPAHAEHWRPWTEAGSMPRPRASVMIKHGQGEPPIVREAVQALVAGAVQGMHPEDVAVIFVAAGGTEPSASATLAAAATSPSGVATTFRPADNWVRMGPVRVARESEPWLRWIGAMTFGLNVVLVVGVVALLRQRRRRPLAVFQDAEAMAADGTSSGR